MAMRILIEHACPLCIAITKAGAGPTNTHIKPLSVGAHLTLDSKNVLTRYRLFPRYVIVKYVFLTNRQFRNKCIKCFNKYT